MTKDEEFAQSFKPLAKKILSFLDRKMKGRSYDCVALNMNYTENTTMRFSEDTVEGPRAFAEKRKPNWKGQ